MMLVTRDFDQFFRNSCNLEKARKINGAEGLRFFAKFLLQEEEGREDILTKQRLANPADNQRCVF